MVSILVPSEILKVHGAAPVNDIESVFDLPRQILSLVDMVAVGNE
jgi:hypothetical protein